MSFATQKAAAENKVNVRKSLGVLVALAPISAEPITVLTGPDKGLLPLPTDYIPLGLMSEDGLSFSRETDSEEVRALGVRGPVRRDITSDEHQITLNSLEVDKKVIAELVYGIDLSAVVPNENGGIVFDIPEASTPRQYRLVAIARDRNQTTGADIYRGRFYYNVELSEAPSEDWGTDANVAEITLTAKADEDTDNTARIYVEGPGLDAVKDLGYKAGV